MSATLAEAMSSSSCALVEATTTFTEVPLPPCLDSICTRVVLHVQVS